MYSHSSLTPQPGRTRSNVSQLLHNFILIDNRILQSKILNYYDDNKHMLRLCK